LFCATRPDRLFSLPVQPTPGHPPAAPAGRYLYVLALGALGVVYGDIGTSPLYAIKQCFAAIPPTQENVLGVLSLVFWSLTAIISVWYLGVIMRADNRGEGGILALAALFGPLRGVKPAARRPLYMILGIFGAALLYGDGMITPAISVLGAVEGLSVATPVFQPYIVPIVLVILIGLFAVQRHGTARVGSMFGPITVLWFATIALLGLVSIARDPEIFAAINPLQAVRFFSANGWVGFVVLGSVFLVVTGGEALYADMGHFGRKPIRLAWYSLVFPALLLNYFGQGAELLRDPAAAANPFYLMAPSWGVYPLVLLATAAAVIASQAVISGAFSLTRQAVQLGLCPRIAIRHTSAREIGQIYVPHVNWALLLASIGLVVAFRSSGNLAAAYGVAVTATMAITSILIHRVMRRVWGWGVLAATVTVVPFLTMDLSFFGANALKIPTGGWFPLAVGAVGYVMLSTWQRGRELLAVRLSEVAVPLEILLGDLADEPPARVPGTAVFLTGQPDGVPHTLLYNLRHNKVLHERNVFLTIMTEEIPHVPEERRVKVDRLADEMFRVTARYGFMDEPDVPEILESSRSKGLNVIEEATTYFVGRETLLATKRPGMPLWREKLFALMSRNTQRATTAFNVPSDHVIEIGAQIEL
jgi:KUP system potassium uptake protein